MLHMYIELEPGLNLVDLFVRQTELERGRGWWVVGSLFCSFRLLDFHAKTQGLVSYIRGPSITLMP